MPIVDIEASLFLRTSLPGTISYALKLLHYTQQVAPVVHSSICPVTKSTSLDQELQHRLGSSFLVLIRVSLHILPLLIHILTIIATDPGILINIYSTISDYTIPGPSEVFTG